MLVSRAGNNKMLARKANREDTDQTASEAPGSAVGLATDCAMGPWVPGLEFTKCLQE